MKSVLALVGGVVGWVVSQTGLVAILPKGVQAILTPLAAVLGILGVRGATPGNPLQHALDTMGTGWKTVTGCVAAVLGYLLDPAVLGGVPPTLAKVLQVVGVVLAALGLYHAKTAA
jgi:hypothetical protein